MDGAAISIYAMFAFLLFLSGVAIALPDSRAYSVAQVDLSDSGSSIPPPPTPELIEITRVPLPPVTDGECTSNINPHGTGCVSKATGLQLGNFLSDDKHVLATVKFTGAPASPDPASIYSGQQVIIIKADGSLFSNGDSWKCITCGISPTNNHTIATSSPDYSYPQAFRDGKRVLAGFYIIDCGRHQLSSSQCTSEQLSIYSIRLENTKDGSGPGASLRELRLHPDQVHIGVNSFDFSSGALGQFAYIGRLTFNRAPVGGTPLAPRYDLTNVNRLYDPNGPPALRAEGDQLFINNSAIAVGELRGFTGTGKEVTYIGNPVESCNIDVFAADLRTGKVRRLTTHPGYVDPVEFSPDDGSFVIMDTRGSGRTEFMDGLRGIPPVTDLITATACASVRNNGPRRFFQPWLLDRFGDRGDYYGQEVNGASNGTAGSGEIDDPEWNGMADPWFSHDGTRIVYWQAQTVSPQCGGDNPLPCYPSKEPGGRTERILIATLISRQSLARRKAAQIPDVIPWATKYVPGDSLPSRATIPEGNYTLRGRVSGSAFVSIVDNVNKTAIETVEAAYNDYSDDGLGTLNSYQKISTRVQGFTLNFLDWYTTLRRSGQWAGIQKSSKNGFHMSIDVLTNEFEANGTLTTTVGGIVYKQPLNGA